MTRAGLPHFAAGDIIKGFGRGSNQLGIPTANYPKEVVDGLPEELTTGIYFGLAQVDDCIYDMVMSIGWNPYYMNKQKSMETHIIHEFQGDLYGKSLKVAILGYLRPEKNFPDLDELIKAIREDIDNAKEELAKEQYLKYRDHDFFKH